MHLFGNLSKETEFVWILLHGYRQSAQEFLALFANETAPNRCILAPEGLSKFYSKGGEGPVVASWMTKENRSSEIQDYLAYLNTVLNHVREKAPQAGVFLLGFSQGAATAARFFCQAESKAVHSLVLWGAVFPPDIEFNLEERNKVQSIFLINGSFDPYYPKSPIIPDFAKHAVRIVFEGGHELPPFEIKNTFQRIEQTYVAQTN